MPLAPNEFNDAVKLCVAAGEAFLKREAPHKLTITLFRYEPDERETVIRTGPASGALLAAMGVVDGKSTPVVDAAVKELFAEAKAVGLGYFVLGTPAKRKGMSVRDISLIRAAAGD